MVNQRQDEDLAVVYDEKEASVAQDRDADRCMLPAYGMLPTLQIPNLYGLPKDKINCNSK